MAGCSTSDDILPFSMDMDFLTDEILRTLDPICLSPTARSNLGEGLDSYDPLNFMHGVDEAGSAHLQPHAHPHPHHNHSNNNANGNGNGSRDNSAYLSCGNEAELSGGRAGQAVPQQTRLLANSVAHTNGNSNSNNHNSNSNSSSSSQAIVSQLPESPPDSEPPYSPLQERENAAHGLTLTSREIYGNVLGCHGPGGGGGGAGGAGGNGTVTGTGAATPGTPVHEIQFATPPHQPQYHSHHLQQQQLLHQQQQQQQGGGFGQQPGNGEVRVKHESGLVLNPTALVPHLGAHLHHSQHQHQHQQHQQQQQQQQQHPHSNLMPHAGMGLEPGMLYSSNNNSSSYAAAGLYPGSSYAQDSTNTNSNSNSNNSGSSIGTPTTSFLTSISDETRVVQVVGTSQSPAFQQHASPFNRAPTPSSPISMSSRKRKMSTQIDGPDFAHTHAHAHAHAHIKPDPLSPGTSTTASATTNSSTNGGAVGSLASLLQESPHKRLAPSSPMASTPVPSSSTASSPLHMLAAHGGTAGHGGGPNADSNNLDSLSLGHSGAENGDGGSLTQSIQFAPFQPHNWHDLSDQNTQVLPELPHFHVDADKGFNYSSSDEAFVCQKKNHFQITCHAQLPRFAQFVRTPSGLEKINAFHLHFYGVKLEAPNQSIRIEQSQSDRSKKPYIPKLFDLQSQLACKETVGRLHFSETTNNNMRKKGRPNPEQRYFQLVVGLHAHTFSGDYPIISYGSERIIVRASNPGQFESDVDQCWQRGQIQDSIFHAGRVGINTDRPDESLVVHGNLKVSGHIVHPSDSRAKKEISELDTSVQLRNLLKIRIVRYRYEPEFATHSGLRKALNGGGNGGDELVDTGVIAQEVRDVIPDAVKNAGSVVLPNGQVIDNFLFVNKDRILMENIGAVKELNKVTESLKLRVKHLENAKAPPYRFEDEMFSNRTLQMAIYVLVIVMAACLAAVSTLYFLEHNRQREIFDGLSKFQPSIRPDMSVLTEQRDNYLVNPPLDRKFHPKFESPPQLLHPQRPNKTHPEASNKSTELGGTGASGGLGGPSSETRPLQLYKKPYPKGLAQRAGHHGRVSSTSSSTIAANVAPPSQQQQPPPLAPNHEPEVDTDAEPEVKSEAEHEAQTTATIDESSSEKDSAAATLPVAQNIDTNSIDAEPPLAAQRKPSAVQNTSLLQNARYVLVESDDGDIAFRSNDGDVVASTSSSNVLSKGVLDAAIYASNKVPGLDDEQLPFPMEPTPISSRSRRPLDVDLQNLSNNNDSLDSSFNRLGRDANQRRATVSANASWLTQRSIRMDIFGAPPHCVQTSPSHATRLNCQSFCFEDSNQLPILRQHDLSNPTAASGALNERHTQNVDNENADTKDVDADTELNESPVSYQQPAPTNATVTLEIGKTSHATQAVAKQLSTEQQSEDVDTYGALSEENYGMERKQTPIEVPAPSTDAHQPPISDCWPIIGFAVADGFNATLGTEHFCPNAKSLNITYTIPLSRFFKDKIIELHLSSLTPLLWHVCENANEINVRSTQHPLDTATGQSETTNLLQKHQNTSVLQLKIPTRGYFMKEVSLRATDNMDKQNLCAEKPHEQNAILQYNFRILRDCD